MPSLLERARRVRHRDTTEIPTPDPATEHHASAPAHPVASTVAAIQADPAVSGPATPDSAAPEPDPATDPAAPDRHPESSLATSHIRIARTRISGAWVAAIVAVVGLVFLLIFILQNLTRANVYFLGAAGTLPMGVAMLLAAVAGALLIALFGSARVLQLRRTAHRRRH